MPRLRYLRGEGLGEKVQDAGFLELELLGSIPTRTEPDNHGARQVVMDLLGDAGGFDPVAQIQKNDGGILDRKGSNDFLGVGYRRDLVTGLKCAGFHGQHLNSVGRNGIWGDYGEPKHES